MEDALELVMTPTLGAAGVRVRLVKRITSIGSAPDADLRFHSLPAHWATVQRDGGGAMFHVLGGGGAHRLTPGESITVDGMAVELGVPRGLAERALDELASRLAVADTPDAALAALLDGALAAAGADLAAIVLSDGATGWQVAAAREHTGAPLAGADALLTDTIVRDVLAGGEHALVANLASHPRHARAPSAVTFGLGAALCLPLRLDGRTIGAIFLGAHGRRPPFGERTAADLRLLTALAVPLVAQLRRRALAAAPAAPADLLIGESPAIEQIRRLVQRVAPADISVLIVGAAGTGKAVVARAIHAASARVARPLITLACASLADTELAGAAAAAHDSTLFLEEIGDLSPAAQQALLECLASRTVDIRVVAATRRDLVAEVAAGRFREDLLFRLQEMRIDLPPLRERGDDIALLAALFLRRTEAHLALPAHALALDAAELLARYPWPGNVRELAATMRRAAIHAADRTVTVADLALTMPPPPIPRPLTPPLGTVAPLTPAPGGSHDLGDTSRPLTDARDDFVRRYVAAVLDRCAGNREAAARQLGIGVRTLYRYLG